MEDKEKISELRKDIAELQIKNLMNEVKFELINEGRCVQILHIGDYSTISESWEKIRKFIEEEDLVEDGLHHEIYLSDARRSSEGVERTILRQPVNRSEYE